MKLAAYVFERLPPTRILIAGAFAAASYLVTSVWKADLDDRISAFQRDIEKIEKVEDHLKQLPIWQAEWHSWQELIMLQRLQIHIFDKTIDKKDPDPIPVMELEEQDHRNNALADSEFDVKFLLTEFPQSILALKATDPTTRNFIFTDSKWAQSIMPEAIAGCIGIGGGNPSEIGDEYSKRLGIYYIDQDKKVSNEVRPQFQSLVSEQLRRLDIDRPIAREFRQAAAFHDPGGVKVPDINPFNDEEAAAAKELPARRAWMVSCLDEADKGAFANLSTLFREVRANIRNELIAPLETRKRWVERLETLL